MKFQRRATRLPQKKQDEVPFQVLLRLIPPHLKDFGRWRKMCYNRDSNVIDEMKLVLKNFEATSNSEILEFQELYQMQNFLKKFPFKGSLQECKENAIERFEQSQTICKKANYKLKSLKNGKLKWDVHQSRIVQEAISILASMLGSLDLQYVLDNANNGTGVSYNPDCPRNGQQTTEYFKLRDKVSHTPSARCYVATMIDHQSSYCRYLQEKYEATNINKAPKCTVIYDHMRVVEGNRITTVPKDKTTDRVIAIEPSGNLALQKGTGALIKKRMRHFGFDLSQQEKNQTMARLGSLGTGLRQPFATVDMQMASDTVSIEVARLLLPPDWFNWLMLIRSPQGKLGNTSYVYENLSSMGNATTFEVESAIFSAIALASMRYNGFQGCHRGYLTIFGDDLVLPGEFYSSCTRTMHYVGFLINHEKSFHTGTFRESCGSDYVNGHNVRPVFLRRSVTDTKDLNFLANSLMLKYYTSKVKSQLLLNAYKYVLSCYPKPSETMFPIPIRVYRKTYYAWDKDILGDLESGVMMTKEFAINFPSVTHTKPPKDKDQPYYQSLLYRQLLSAGVTHKDDDPECDHVRYLIFLLGHRNGLISLRASKPHKLVVSFSSSWDGYQTAPLPLLLTHVWETCLPH